MGIDIRNSYDRNEYKDRYKIYSVEAVNKNKLVKDAVCVGVFYGKDIIPFQWERPQIGNGIFSTNIQFRGTVETPDDVSMIRPNMYVTNPSNKLFIVCAPIIVKDNGHKFNSRPSNITSFVLQGLDND